VLFSSLSFSSLSPLLSDASPPLESSESLSLLLDSSGADAADTPSSDSLLSSLLLASFELSSDSSSPSLLSLDSSDPESGVVVVINSVFSSPFLLLSLGSSSLLRVL
jgi:hypothetical protein